MAIETKTVAICDICGYMVEADGEGSVGGSKTPDTWSHGKNGTIDICPRCAKKLERPEWNTRSVKGYGTRYGDVPKPKK